MFTAVMSLAISFILLPLAIAQGAGSVDGNPSAIPTSTLSQYSTVGLTTVPPSVTSASITTSTVSGSALVGTVTPTGTAAVILASQGTTVIVPTSSHAAAAKELGQSWMAAGVGAVAMGMAMI